MGDRWTRAGLSLVLAGVVCSGCVPDDTAALSGADTTATEAGSETGMPGGPSGTSEDGGSSGDAETTTGTSAPSGWTPELVDYELRCKLVSDESEDDPSLNATHTRFNLRGTDLGIPVVIGQALHLFFGDTHGYRVIWAPGEDPDSVAFVDAAAAADDPDVLCSELQFYVTPDQPSVAAGVDPQIERDFAAGSMTAPQGESLADYITQHPAPFPSIPGSFEVPSGALALGDAVYLAWAGKAEFQPYARMTVSYLARWDAPRTLPNYQIVRRLDALNGGALGGHFIQVLPLAVDDFVYLLGTGDFRHSGVYLARVPAAALPTGRGQEVFDPKQGQWLDPAALDAVARAAVPPMFEDDGVGELGGVFVPGPDQFLVMYQRELHGGGGEIIDNRIVVRTASDLEGPWSDPVTVIDMADPDFGAAHCCGTTCGAQQILHCAVAGLYGAYPLPSPVVTPLDGGALALDVPFVASTWDPYNVVLLEAHLRLQPTD